MRKLKLLLVTNSFPPMGGPGVQRNLKFIKYWTKFGHKPFVLTPKEVTFPHMDYELLKEVPNETTIIRVNTLDPKRLFFLLKKSRNKQSNINKSKSNKSEIEESSFLYVVYRFIVSWFCLPDVGILSLPFSVIKGRKTVKNNNIDLIVASCPGPSTIISSYFISKLTKVPFVIDFRDGWMDYPYNRFPTSLHRNINSWLEKRFLTKASMFITYGSYLTNKLKERYNLDSKLFVEISNGFDPFDFKHFKYKKSDDNKVHIVHSGNIYNIRRPVFEKTLTAFNNLSIEYKDRIVFDFIGAHYKEAPSFIKSLGIEKYVNFFGYQNHENVIKFLERADATLVLLPVGDLAAFTGKVFEYIAVGKTIVEVGEPNGSCAKLLRSLFGNNVVAHPDDFEKIKEILKTAVNNSKFELDSTVKLQFSRENQAKRFIESVSTVLESDNI